jgi:hypothetical protein
MHFEPLSLSVAQKVDDSVQLLVRALFYLCAINLGVCASAVNFGFRQPLCCPGPRGGDAGLLFHLRKWLEEHIKAY